MSGKAVREILGFLGVIASLAFVGLQVRQSNIQARAAAYQEIGIATADWHQGMDETLLRLSREAEYAEAITRWDAMDWEAYSRKWLAGVRLGETVLLQVEQGLLEPDMGAVVDVLDALSMAQSAAGLPAGLVCC